MKTLLTVCLAALLLSGCATNKAIDQIGAISENTATAQLACYDAWEAEAKVELAALDKIPANDVTMYLMTRMMAQNSLAMVSVATGKSYDKCGGTNVYDFLARMSEAEYRMVSNLGGGLFRLVTWWAVTHEVSGFGQELANSRGIEISGSNNELTQKNVGNRLSAGKDSTYLSGENASMNKVDNDVVQNQAAADTTGDNINNPTAQPTESVEPEPETEIDVNELEIVE